MRLRYKVLIVGLVHLLLVSSLGGIFLYDRWTAPRGWARTAPFDPNLPIRGRFVRLRLRLEVKKIGDQSWDPSRNMSLPGQRVRLMVEGERVVAVVDRAGKYFLRNLRWEEGRDNPVSTLRESLAFFIPEHVPDPSRRGRGEELWVEVTIPKRGPPRPIQLGVRKDGGEIVPLGLD